MRKADNLPPYRAVVMKSGSLNFLEPSGPAQACYGRALPFSYDFSHGMYMYIIVEIYISNTFISLSLKITTLTIFIRKYRTPAFRNWKPTSCNTVNAPDVLCYIYIFKLITKLNNNTVNTPAVLLCIDFEACYMPV